MLIMLRKFSQKKIFLWFRCSIANLNVPKVCAVHHAEDQSDPLEPLAEVVPDRPTKKIKKERKKLSKKATKKRGTVSTVLRGPKFNF